MVETSGQALIRGVDITKGAVAEFEEALIFKPLISSRPTKAREIKFWVKTSGYLTLTSPAKLSNIAPGARPFVAETSWTPDTKYSIKYMLDSPMINMEDESDAEVQVFRDNAKDVVEAIANDVDNDIWNVATENQSPSLINSTAANAAWNAASGQDPFEDIMEAKQEIREETKRSIKNGVLLLNAKGEKDLLVWLVSTKGSSIPNFASEKVGSGTLSGIAGLRVIVSENVTATFAMVADLKQAVEYRQFKPLQTWIITEEGIGRKIRVSTNGVAILRKPKYISLITGVR
ncbi:hypothetical protein LCGC14_2678270 [marine sediment metagenome]|uniref:Phage major capsid protein n=1 Tax=marine sediment metagenome TaxID=412755 RepID=A0A0F8ZM36_9ZZZZ